MLRSERRLVQFGRIASALAPPVAGPGMASRAVASPTLLRGLLTPTGFSVRVGGMTRTNKLVTTVVAADLQPGDVWTSDSDDVAIHNVTQGAHPADLLQQTSGWVIFQGTITRGYGRGTKTTWKILATQHMDVIR